MLWTLKAAISAFKIVDSLMLASDEVTISWLIKKKMILCYVNFCFLQISLMNHMTHLDELVSLETVHIASTLVPACYKLWLDEMRPPFSSPIQN